MSNILFFNLNVGSANTVCINNILPELVDAGHEVFCITDDELLLSKSTSKIHYLYIKHNQSSSKIRLFFKKIWMLICIVVWPFLSPIECIKDYIYIEKIVCKYKIDVIIPQYGKINNLIIGWSLKCKFKNLIYVPYFLDALYAGHTPSYMTQHRKKTKALMWERRLLNNADKVIMMKTSQNAYLKDSIEEAYLQKTIFLDIPLFNSIEYKKEKKIFANEEKVFLFVGSTAKNVRDPEFILKIFSELKNDKFRFCFIGSCVENDKIINSASNDSRYILIKRVSREKLESYMREADFFINIGNNDAYMTPSKIFEYMSYGKPIISTAAINEDSSINYLNIYNNSIVLKQGNANESCIQQLVDFINSEYKQFEVNELNNMMVDKKKFYNNTSKAFVDRLNDIIYNVSERKIK